MSALLVDERSWIPADYIGPAALGAECAGGTAGPGEFFGAGEGLLVCVERVFFPAQSRPDVLVARDQIACFDPVLVPVRDAEGRAAFPEMSEPFDPAGSERAHRAAENLGLTVRTGCLAGLREPDLLTPAEWTALASLGADAVCRWLHLAVRRARAVGTPVVGVGVEPGLEPETVRALISDLA